MPHACTEGTVLTKLRHVNFINNTSTHGHLPEFRVGVKDIEVEAAVVHINLEVPAWNKLITNINSCTSLNPDRAANSFSLTISIKITKPSRGLTTRLNRILEQQIPADSTLLLLRTEHIR